jgi:cystathionine beta-lyase/cystathionine gamma-synthase
MTGFGGMINVILRAEKKDYFTFLGALRVITHAVCLGHAESLVQYYPQEGNHPELGVLNYPEDIGEGFLRVSIGLEDPQDLIDDLSQALAKLG